MNNYRKAIEIQKMLNRFKEEDISVQLGYGAWYDYVQLGPDKKSLVQCKDAYLQLKKMYFEIFQREETEEIVLEIDEEILVKAYKIADERGILIDEYINETLELYINEMVDLDEEIQIKELELAELKNKRNHI